MSFDELWDGLRTGAAAGTIAISRDGDLELFGYTTACQYEQRWDLFSLIARGLILDARRKRVIATPFPKFFNYGEAMTAPPDEPFEATEKLDGSLGICFYHNTGWRVSTRGQLTSEQGAWATRHLNEQIAIGELTPGTTYLFEIIYQANRIVIPYEFEGLVLLGAYDEQGIELSRAKLEDVALRAGLRIARAVAWPSLADMVNAAAGLSHFEEGFVVRFAGGLRLKLKGEAYCRLHKLICRCTPLALWEAMMLGENLDTMRLEIPEELRRDFDAIRQLLTLRFTAIVAEIREGHERHAGLSDKELGLLIQSGSSALTETQRAFCFACRQRDFLNAVHEPGTLRRNLFRMIRPDGNRLAGYMPSNAMTRFAEESG